MLLREDPHEAGEGYETCETGAVEIDDDMWLVLGSLEGPGRRKRKAQGLGGGGDFLALLQPFLVPEPDFGGVGHGCPDCHLDAALGGGFRPERVEDRL